VRDSDVAPGRKQAIETGVAERDAARDKDRLFTEGAEKEETRCYHGAEAASLEQGKQDAASYGVGAAEVP
jgi:hypothetical protein